MIAFFHVFIGYVYVLSEEMFRSSALFLIGFYVFLLLSCMNLLYILEINPLSVASFAVFSHSEGCLFLFFTVFFAVAKDFKFN